MLKAEEGNFEEVQKVLADLQQTNINAINRNGSTALSLAAKNGSYGIVEALINTGADVNIRNSVLINIFDDLRDSLDKVLCFWHVGTTLEI